MKRILLSLAAALCMCASAAAQTVAPFKDGDRAVFLGNSITDGGHYHSYIWLYYMTRFPYKPFLSQDQDRSSDHQKDAQGDEHTRPIEGDR